MALRKKLYYNITITQAGEAQLIQVGAATADNPVAIRFTGSTGVNFGADADFDRYGNVMEPNQFNGANIAGASGNVAKCRQAIGAWFQIATVEAPESQGLQSPIRVDFIAETGVVSTLPSIDPATVRRPRIRLRYLGVEIGNGSGVLYVQRQHAMEV